MQPRFPRRDSLQTFLLSEAYRILCRCHWSEWPDETLLTFANDARYGVRIVIGPSGAVDAPANNGPVNIVVPPTFAPLELDILRVITSAPQTANRLANRADRQHNSQFRRALTELSRKGIVVRVPDGWRWA